jgi:hypothetical protein
MKKYKVYADTSVFGGCFDSEFSDDSISFFQMVINGFFKLYLSSYVFEELQKAPPYVRNLLKSFPEDSVVIIEYNEEIEILANKYIKSGVLTSKSLLDAEHVAAATINEVDFIVSWNFKHIVHFDKINGFNAVNLLNGYRKVDIYSPKQVI